jgi:hypothetical protein
MIPKEPARIMLRGILKRNKIKGKNWCWFLTCPSDGHMLRLREKRCVKIPLEAVNETACITGRLCFTEDNVPYLAVEKGMYFNFKK